MPYVSKHKFIFGADYEIVSDLHLFADYKFYSKKKDLNYDNISSRSIVDAGVSYKFKNGFGITGSVKNLFNKNTTTTKAKTTKPASTSIAQQTRETTT